jgi:integrase
VATIVKRLNKNGSMSYKAVIRKLGEPTQVATFKTETAAQKWANSVEDTIITEVQQSKIGAQVLTFEHLVARYRREVSILKAPTTRMSDHSMLHFWAKAFGATALYSITSEKVSKHQAALLDEFKPNTVRRYMAVLSAVMSTAIDWNWLKINPVKRLQQPALELRDVVLSSEELQRLFDACQHSRNKLLYPLVVVTLATGGRKREIETLQWHQVDLDSRVVRLIKTKGNKARSVKLIAPAVSELRQLYMARGSSPYVFAMKNGQCIQKSYNAWNMARQRAGVAHVHFHDLRHTTASYLAMHGASLSDIKEILGHTTIATTQRYIHYLKPVRSETLETLTSLFQ